MKKYLINWLLCMLVITAAAQSQTCDPWIVSAYRQLYQREPSANECNIKNYNNGTWNSYCELVEYIATYNRNKSGTHLKGDPWIFRAYCELYSRVPSAWELNINNYNGGSWNSYADLKSYIQQYQTSLIQNSVQVIMAKAIGSINTLAVVFTSGGKVIAADLIGNDAGSVLATGGKELAAQGVTKLIGLDGATLIGNDAGSLISNLPGVSFSTGNYNLQSSGGARVIRTAGKTSLIIK